MLDHVNPNLVSSSKLIAVFEWLATLPTSFIITATISHQLILFSVLSSVVSVSLGAKASSQYANIAEHRMIMYDRAILHVNLMNTIGLCRDPRPLVVYPPSTTNKIYSPRGTVRLWSMQCTGVFLSGTLIGFNLFFK